MKQNLLLTRKTAQNDSSYASCSKSSLLLKYETKNLDTKRCKQTFFVSQGPPLKTSKNYLDHNKAF